LSDLQGDQGKEKENKTGTKVVESENKNVLWGTLFLRCRLSQGKVSRKGRRPTDGAAYEGEKLGAGSRGASRLKTVRKKSSFLNHGPVMSGSGEDLLNGLTGLSGGLKREESEKSKLDSLCSRGAALSVYRRK